MKGLLEGRVLHMRDILGRWWRWSPWRQKWVRDLKFDPDKAEL
jgi:hypothetical protein